ncbi:pyridoxamine 5'-phosphate oxidase family protein [Mycolicibacterium sp.]|uniref:pyridoxamine 5'-phosphate oxidase family protein n=1 Tax=Mycolicibacterium sp. TaxID=2320850 RepID=UPI003D0D7964
MPSTLTFTATSTQNVRTLGAILESLDTVTLTTVTRSNRLVGRPMALCVDNFDGTLWFFAPMTSRIIVDVVANPEVNISYIGPLTSLSITGTATLTPNLAQTSARWRRGLGPWFPGGMDDAAMIEVAADEARLWTLRPELRV